MTGSRSTAVRIRLRLELACSPDAAWRALHSPSVAASVYAPVVVLTGVDPLPPTWQPGDSAVVRSQLFGVVPFGTQRIAVQRAWVRSGSPTSTGGDGGAAALPVFHDGGGPLTGPLALLSSWDHRMWVEPVPGRPDRTTWHDSLVVDGPVAPLLSPGLRVAWLLRGVRLRQLARRWS